jgi:hypothetical protein
VADFSEAHWGAIAGADFFTTQVWTWLGLVTYDTVFAIDVSVGVHVSAACSTTTIARRDDL